jgi:hypothetical protein
VKTMRLMSTSVMAEMNPRRTRNSNTCYCQAVPLIRMSPSGTAL